MPSLKGLSLMLLLCALATPCLGQQREEMLGVAEAKCEFSIQTYVNLVGEMDGYVWFWVPRGTEPLGPAFDATVNFCSKKGICQEAKTVTALKMMVSDSSGTSTQKCQTALR
jgi:hypothetical protein